MKLYVDDIRDPKQPRWWQFWKERWTVARTHDEAIRLLTDNDVNTLSLDHDLGTYETGYDIAKWLEKRAYYGFRVPDNVLIHSANPVGRSNIRAAIAGMRRNQSGR